jgi:hypothetical protein
MSSWSSWLGRCRPNTVLAVAYDLKVFFTVIGKPPRRVRPADVLAFMTAQRNGGDGRLQLAGADGVSARTLRRRLSSVYNPPAFCWTCGFAARPCRGCYKNARASSGSAELSVSRGLDYCPRD